MTTKNITVKVLNSNSRVIIGKYEAGGVEAEPLRKPLEYIYGGKTTIGKPQPQLPTIQVKPCTEFPDYTTHTIPAQAGDPYSKIIFMVRKSDGRDCKIYKQKVKSKTGANVYTVELYGYPLQTFESRSDYNAKCLVRQAMKAIRVEFTIKE